MSEPLWRPDAERAKRARLNAFLEAVAGPDGRRLASFDDVHRASIAAPEWFWREAWRFCGVKGDMGAGPVLEGDKAIHEARFFPAGRLSFAENLLSKDGEDAAIVFRGETRVARRMSWGELRLEVARLSESLRDAGVKPGDRVAAMLPNMPEAIVGVLATAAIGAVWSSCSPDFGVQGVIDRFGQIEPKVLIASDGYFYAGRAIDLSDKLAEIAFRLPTVARIVVVSYLGAADGVVQALNTSLMHQDRRAVTWANEVARRSPRPLTFERFPFSHPLYILFSSGTTGVPKCIVHSAGGTLLKHVVEQQLHSDIRPGDRLFYFTTLGWMMWNWLVSGLASGATLLLYDGQPMYPDGNALWDFARDEACTHFGTSAKYIDSLRKAELAPGRTHDLSKLRAILSTGSPLAPESFDYVYSAIKRDVHLASISGGTDIVGCFVLGNPLGPVHRGEIQAAGLGMAIQVVDGDGKAMARGKGELVCAKPFPSQPLGFFGDTDGKRYRAAYYDRFPGLWHHGDFAEWTENGGMIIHGRSDATLNPGGVRIGTAEIYRQVEQLSEVQEAIVIGQDWDNDVRVVLFVVLRAGARLDGALVDRIKRQIRTGASPRHVPAKIIAVADIPRTKSGKITELAVRDIVHGREVKNKEALANPEALAHFRDLADLKR